MEKSKHKIIIVIGITILLGFGVYLFFFYTKGNQLEDKKGGAYGNFEGDPIEFNWDIFEKNNYKVSVGGQELSEYLQYYEKGELVRLGNPQDKPNTGYMIFKNDKLFVVYPVEKEFKEYGSDDEMYELMQKSAPILTLRKLINDQESDVEWVNAGDGYFTTKEAMNLQMGVDDGKIPVNVKIELDDYGMISKVLLKMEGGEWDNWFEMQYEVIGDLTELKKFPIDYEKVN